jgi:hypothetical protein
VNHSYTQAGCNNRLPRLLLAGIALFFSTSAAILYFYVSDAATVIGSSPDQAITLATGANNGILGPGERRWFRLMPDEQGGTFQDVSLSLMFSASGLVPSQDVNFQLFAPAEVQAWQQGQKASATNFGAGMVVGQGGVQQAGERIWQGTVLGDTSYYLSVDNQTPETVDYWLFDGAVPVESPTVPAPEEVVVADKVGQSPGMAITFAAEKHKGNLQPGEEAWYRLVVGDVHPDQFEPVALTLVTTPNNLWPVEGVGLDIFTVEAVQVWSPQNREGPANLGAGSLVTRDNNPLTGERAWGGWLMNNETYYVRIANNTGGVIDYWLFDGDIYSPLLD